MEEHMAFPFENLTVYKIALEWVADAARLAAAIKSSELAPLADQLIRAATSIALNIAEGNGRWHKGDKRQFFWIARGSTFECVAILQVAKANGIIAVSSFETAYQELQTLAKMLTKLIQSVGDLRSKYPPTPESNHVRS
jgi:four helix bundle protein